MLQSDQTTTESETAGETPGAAADAGAEPADLLSVEGATSTIMETLRDIWVAFFGHLPLIVAGVLVIVATFFVAMIARSIVSRSLSGVSMRRSLKQLIERITVLLVWILGLMLAAMVVFPNLDPADALAALGVGSIAIGLAFKDIFENLFAGVLILWRFPFENGDFIECEGITGSVENVTVRNTVIRTTSGELIVVPNSTIYKNPVEILTNRKQRRAMIICGVAYDEDVAEARSVIESAMSSCSTVADDKPVQVFAREFNSSSVDFEIAWWTGSTPLEQRQSKDEVVEAVKRALDDAGIEIPFPYRTLTFKEPLSIDGERDQDDSKPA